MPRVRKAGLLLGRRSSPMRDRAGGSAADPAAASRPRGRTKDEETRSAELAKEMPEVQRSIAREPQGLQMRAQVRQLGVREGPFTTNARCIGGCRLNNQETYT